MVLYRQPGSKNWYAWHYAGGQKHRKSMRTPDKLEAGKRARKWAAELDEKHSVRRESVALSFAVDRFIRHCQESELARSTVRNYTWRIRFFLNHVGDADLADWSFDIALDSISDYLHYRREVCKVKSMNEDRLVLSAFFSYVRYKRWYRGDNPAEAKLHQLRRPRSRMKRQVATTREEDLVIRKEGSKTPLWPVILLARWAGMRRGEACTLRWSEVSLDEGFADIVGHEGGRKHVRRVWLAPWIVMQLRALRPKDADEDPQLRIWPYSYHWATHLWMLANRRKPSGTY